MPKRFRAIPQLEHSSEVKKGKTVDSYYVSIHCMVCQKQTTSQICDECSEISSIPKSISVLSRRLGKHEAKYRTVQEICRACTGHSTMFDADSACISLDCPIFFTRSRQQEKVRLGSRWLKMATSLDTVNMEDVSWFKDVDF